jgi:hypothetical protein
LTSERDHIERTVRRTPEVMIKVSGGGRSFKAVKDHIEYIDREGNLDLETDEGERLNGDEVAKRLIEDWDLDVDVVVSNNRSDISRPKSSAHKTLCNDSFRHGQ